ncbi:TIGR03089 family protein [uncultured Phycicoccus sp.]|uniref:TIGR03089 family protein n=1 Tax=uncultured Phycicoccus sp. TaxID=661422 RepID=UPI0026075B32|nr:TIGR03089 family protein [uncultured Phycicoccus sp.]
MASTTPPAALLARLVEADPGRPRVTYYDDTDGPTRGERIELSARVLANWVAKAANLLQDELDVGPGAKVRLDLPPHWRTLYWAFAAWAVGARVVVGDVEVDAPVDVLVTDDPGTAGASSADRLVVVTLAALARQAAGSVPNGGVDEARELATHGDLFDPYDAPAPDDPALVTTDGVVPFAALVPAAPTGGRVHTATTDVAAFLATTLEAWAADGSVVLTRGAPDADVLAARLTTEGVTRHG